MPNNPQGDPKNAPGHDANKSKEGQKSGQQSGTTNDRDRNQGMPGQGMQQDHQSGRKNP